MVASKRASSPGGEPGLDFVVDRGERWIRSRRGGREVLGADRLTAGDDGRVLDGVAQLADVAGPGPVAKLVEDVAGERACRHVRSRDCLRKWSARAGMSSRRSRSGGMWIWKTLRRKNRSSRNSPAAISEPSGRLVAAMTRMSVGRGRASPTGVTSRCSMARSSLTWTARGHVADLVQQHRAAAGELEQPFAVLARRR